METMKSEKSAQPSCCCGSATPQTNANAQGAVCDCEALVARGSGLKTVIWTLILVAAIAVGIAALWRSIPLN